MNTQAERVLHLLRARGLTDRQIKPELARVCGVSYQSAQQWLNGATKSIGGEYLAKIARHWGANLDWLVTGRGRMEPEEVPAGAAVAVYDEPGVLDPEAYIWIDRFDLKLSAGNGNAQWVIKEKDPISFRRGWFTQRRLVPENCKAMYVRGRSMEPVLNDWDTVLIDTGDAEVIDGEIFAVVYRGSLYIKTLERMGNGIRLKSENPAFDPIDVPEQELANLKIIGRKVWRAG